MGHDHIRNEGAVWIRRNTPQYPNYVILHGDDRKHAVESPYGASSSGHSELFKMDKDEAFDDVYDDSKQDCNSSSPKTYRISTFIGQKCFCKRERRNRYKSGKY